MTAEDRRFEGRADFDALAGFVRAELLRRWPGASYWHPGDVTWNLYRDADAPSDEIRLWRDTAGLTGYVWLESPGFARLDARPDVPIEPLLAWAEDRGSLSTLVLDGDAERRAALEARGYAATERGNLHLGRSLETAIDAPKLPAGLGFRDARDADPAERAACHRDAWSHLEHLGMAGVTSSFSLERYARLRREPAYRPELDLVVETRDGTHACCLIAWADEASGVGLFEPVGTRAAFRRRGLARALGLEALRRLRDAGMRHARVGTADFNAPAAATYRSCGFELLDRDRIFARTRAG